MTGDQFYVTHCTTADSLMNAPGYSVRAASLSDDPDTLRAALEYPPYELPLAMWKDKPTTGNTPRRLARTRHPRGVWVAHSVFLEEDTMGRDRSFFTHLMHLPTTTSPAAVLESWDAGEWVREYPTGAPKTLEEGTLPVGEMISPAALSGFLSKPQDGPTDLSGVVCPERLRSKVGRHARRELVGRFLKAFLLVTAEKEEGRPRDRLFVHAEPGLVAMLLYAAVRILPPAFTRSLTFSTFEPPHRGLRDYKSATVIGTFMGSESEGLDSDLTTTRGYGLDTLHPELSSPELTGPLKLPKGVVELLDLATSGHWELLRDVHKAIGRDSAALTRISETIARLRVVEVAEPPEPPAIATSPSLVPLPPDATDPGKPPEPSKLSVSPVSGTPSSSAPSGSSESVTPVESVPPSPPASTGDPEMLPVTLPPIPAADAGVPPTSKTPPTPPPLPPVSPPPSTPDEASSPGGSSAEEEPKHPPRRSRHRVLRRMSVAVLLILAAGAVFAAIKFWPHPKPEPIDVTKSDPRQDPAPLAPITPPSKSGLEPSVLLPKPGEVRKVALAPGVEMEFCWVPPGKAQLGASKAEQIALTRIMPGGKRQVWMDAESEQFRPLYTSAGFWLAKYEVTQAEWAAVMGANPSVFNGKSANGAMGLDTSRFPVENLSWFDCQEFIKKLNERAASAGIALGTPVQFALPHEDEWEYACRGGLGNDRPFYFGGVLDGRQANIDGTAPWGVPGKSTKLGRPTTVGSYEAISPHPWGLCDIHGNVAEWCENTYGREENRVLRGGGWPTPAWECRSANRFRANPGIRGAGMRVCVRPLPTPMPGEIRKFEIAPGVLMEFCWVPPGEVQLGSPKSERDEVLKQFIGLKIVTDGKESNWLRMEGDEARGRYKSKGFWLGKYEVTQAEWTAVMGANPSVFNGTNANKARGTDTARFPVENVSWYDCHRFLKKLNDWARATGAPPGVFTLPHDNEWEYACRGGHGNDRPFYWGEEMNGTKANCNG